MSQNPRPLRRPDRDPREWWSTPLGVAARRHLITWGAVELERQVTGDPTALPKHTGISGGGRGGYDLPDTAILHAEVDQWLAANNVARDRQLVEWIYVRGLVERSKTQYVFRDGTRSDVLTDEQVLDRPPVNVLQELRTTWREVRYDILAFPCRETDAFCRAWCLDKASVLEKRHAAIGKALAMALGLTAEVRTPDPNFELEN